MELQPWPPWRSAGGRGNWRAHANEDWRRNSFSIIREIFGESDFFSVNAILEMIENEQMFADMEKAETWTPRRIINWLDR
jgi:hypothetical protein